jgi:hypothetical protein
MPFGCRSAARTLGALVLAGVSGCALVAPLDGLTGGTEGGGFVTAPSADGASTQDVQTTHPGDDSGGPIPPADDGPPAPEDAGTGYDAWAGDDASAGGDTSSGDDVTTIDAPPPPPPPPSIAFVQVASATNPATAGRLSATYDQSQGAGDLNVVAIGWNDTTSSVTSVRDSAGNTYRLAAGPTRYAPDLTQAVYYAQSIAGSGAGANTVTVSFDASANAIDLRILEYAGLSSTSALDVVAAKAGTGSGDVSSGKVATRTDVELIVGAGMSTDVFVNAGSSFNQRAITPLGDIVEDRIVSTIGDYSADAPVGTSCEFVMQMVTFR